MRVITTLLLLAACGHSNPDSGNHCPEQPYESCVNTCGNGTIDTCVYNITNPESASGCDSYFSHDEACDGAAVTTSCTDLGYYGGTTTCGSTCEIDDSGCDPCAAGVACTRHVATIDGWRGLLASGSYLAAPMPEVSVNVSGVTIIDTTSGAPDLTLEVAPVSLAGIAATSQGWLALDGLGTLYPIDHAGTVGVTRQVPFPWTRYEAAMATGPNDKIIVVWTEPSRTRAWIVDSTGMSLVAPFDVYTGSLPDDDRVPVATSDGTAFFVAMKGVVVRVLPDGTVASTATTLPTGAQHVTGNAPILTASTTSRWYAIENDFAVGGYTAQQLDSSGAPTGTAFQLPAGVSPALAFGSDLLAAVALAPDRLAIAHVDGSGAIGPTREIGRVDGSGGGGITSMGASVAIAWFAAQRENLAIVTP